MVIEIILDKDSTIQNEQQNHPKDFQIWFVPLCLQIGSLLLFTLFGILYFIQSQFWPSNKPCFIIGTVFIVISLLFFGLTMIWSPCYFICFLISIRTNQLKIVYQGTPILLCLMVVLQILSCLDMIYVGWIVTHIVGQCFCEKIGLIKVKGQLVQPIKMVNEDKRTTEISKTGDNDIMTERVLLREVHGEYSSQVGALADIEMQ